MKPKHLVLHADVHQKLKRRKSMTGETIQEIGNSILRTALARPLLTDVIAQKLLSAQKLTEAEWESVLEAALKEAQSVLPSISDQIMVKAGTQIENGHWRRRNIYRPPGMAFEVVEFEANNLEVTELVPHVHDGDEFLLVLAGSIRVSLHNEAVTLHPGQSLHFAGSDPHINVPLVQEARILCISIPAWADSAAKLMQFDSLTSN